MHASTRLCMYTRDSFSRAYSFEPSNGNPTPRLRKLPCQPRCLPIVCRNLRSRRPRSVREEGGPISEPCREVRESTAGGEGCWGRRGVPAFHHHAGEARTPNTRPVMVQVHMAPDSVREGVGRGRGDASTAMQRPGVPSACAMSFGCAAGWRSFCEFAASCSTDAIVPDVCRTRHSSRACPAPTCTQTAVSLHSGGGGWEGRSWEGFPINTQKCLDRGSHLDEQQQPTA